VEYTFPFGQKLHPVVQTDTTPKKAFVLGVYASAVHARWIDDDGNQLIAALAVASEPEIFWTGHDAEAQIAKIKLSPGAGKLALPNRNLNGPSGKALDELYLKPLGLTRNETWLCDILPEARLNPNQANAIGRAYDPIRYKLNLPEVTIPKFQPTELNSEARRAEISEELSRSQAETLILLGDLPIKWFLNFVADRKYKNLTAFGDSPDTYGCSHEIKISGKDFRVIPLCHPRQAQRLGASSKNWYELHRKWVQKQEEKHNG
jgi:uracil-DNA glycosylase